MKIKTKLYIGAALSIILISLLAFTIFQLSGEVKKELKRVEFAEELVSGTTELAIITGEYATHHETRMEQQWQSKFDSITEMVKKEEESPLLNEIQTDLESLNNSFSQLKANYERRNELLKENASLEEVEKTIILEERLAARMQVDSTRIWSNAFEIAKESRKRTNDAQRRTSSLVSLFAVFLVAVIGTTMVAVARSITKPIEELVRGAEIVGKGNLDHRIEIKSKDETGYLSQAFNEMVERRKESEEALRESEEKFRGLAEKSLVGVYLIQDEIFKYVNPRLAEIFGYTVEKLIGKKGPENLVLPEDWPIVKENLQKRVSGEIESIRYAFRGLTKNKKIIYVEVYGARTAYQGGPAVIGTLLDITKRKEAEKKIIELKEFNEKIVQNMKEGVIVEDAEGLITYFNPMAEQMLGYTKDELIGQHCSKIVSKRFMKKVEKETSKRPKGITSRYECEIVTKSGEIVPIINSGTPIFEEGEFKGVLSVFMDISEQKEKEEELRKRLMKYRVGWGRVYYVDELKLKLALDAFMDLLGLGYSGAVIARLPPDELKDTIQGKAPVLWLSEKAHTSSVEPEFSVLVDKIDELLTTKKVILFQGLEYLIPKHGYDKTLLFFQELNELFYVENAVLLLSFDSKTLSEQQSGLLKKEARRLVLKREAEMPEKYLSLLRFVYEKNSAGINPSQNDICEHFEITRNTAKTRIKYLAARGLLAEKPKGRSKVLELTELGRDYL